MLTCLEVVESVSVEPLKVTDEADAGVGQQQASGFDLERIRSQTKESPYFDQLELDHARALMLGSRRLQPLP